MSDLTLAARLATAKYHSGTTVSVCIPARDEEATVGRGVGRRDHVRDRRHRRDGPRPRWYR